MGRWIIWIGLFVIIAGIVVHYGDKLGLNNIPGNLSFKKGGTTFYFPIATCLIVSALVSFILWLIRSLK